MIVMNLKGGLGNQLFQYALGRHLASIHNTTLALDTSSFETDPLRNYRLDSFNISATVLPPKNNSFFSRLINKFISEKNPIHRFFNKPLLIIRENGFEFQPNILQSPNNSYLDGYWQSERYFNSIATIIRSELTLSEPLPSQLKEIEDQIRNLNSVAIHVRRGDYASNPHTTAFHGLYPIDWYLNAAKEMQESLGDVHYFIFSDDYDWVKENLKLNAPCTYIQPSPDGKEAQDLYLMSRCKHNITANSSYSWWAAWLNGNPNKKVIAPAKWFMGADLNTKDLIPESWIRQ
jgi:hypothetical protein